VKSKVISRIMILLVAVTLITSCGSDDEPAGKPDTITYKISGTGVISGIASIEYTNADGINTNLNSALPWELSFDSKFDDAETLTLHATSDVEISGEILINGTVVDSEIGGSIITIVYAYTP
jgi:hypothetical protein